MISLVLAAFVAMPNDQIYSAISECKALKGEYVVVRKYKGEGRYFVSVDDSGVEKVECYFQSGSIKVFGPIIEQIPSAMMELCKSKGMNAVVDNNNLGALKCISKNPHSLIGTWK